MKIQDIAFIIVFILIAYLRKPRLAVGVGLVSLIISIPLFAAWIFFTAERLTWYAAAFFLCAVVLHLVKK